MIATGISSAGVDDVFVEVETHDRCSDHVSLRDAVDAEIDAVEFHMCEANARDFYESICAIELIVASMRDKWEEWKRNDFKKDREG